MPPLPETHPATPSAELGKCPVTNHVHTESHFRPALCSWFLSVFRRVSILSQTHTARAKMRPIPNRRQMNRSRRRRWTRGTCPSSGTPGWSGQVSVTVRMKRGRELHSCASRSLSVFALQISTRRGKFCAFSSLSWSLFFCWVCSTCSSALWTSWAPLSSL